MIELIIPAFIAGLVTFLAPCTLPLVPGYLGFISGVRQDKLSSTVGDSILRRKIITNGMFFVAGFTVIFVFFGTVAGLFGGALTPYRAILSQIGGVLVIIFGLFMLGILNINAFKKEHRLRLPRFIEIGSPSASFIVGATFAFGWTPCIGPVLGSILLLASSKTTAFSGAFLLLVFSIGLSIPFILVSLGLSHATRIISNITPYLRIISIFGGLFLVALGILLLTDQFELTVTYGFKLLRLFGLHNLELALLNYL